MTSPLKNLVRRTNIFDCKSLSAIDVHLAQDWDSRLDTTWRMTVLGRLRPFNRAWFERLDWVDN
jgi:hypothetical protein